MTYEIESLDKTFMYGEEARQEAIKLCQSQHKDFHYVVSIEYPDVTMKKCFKSHEEAKKYYDSKDNFKKVWKERLPGFTRGGWWIEIKLLIQASYFDKPLEMIEMKTLFRKKSLPLDQSNRVI